MPSISNGLIHLISTLSLFFSRPMQAITWYISAAILSDATCGPPTDWPPEAILLNDYSPSAPPMFGDFVNFFCPPGFTFGHDSLTHGFQAECRWKQGGYEYQYPEPEMILSDCYRGEWFWRWKLIASYLREAASKDSR